MTADASVLRALNLLKFQKPKPVGMLILRQMAPCIITKASPAASVSMLQMYKREPASQPFHFPCSAAPNHHMQVTRVSCQFSVSQSLC